MKGSYTMDNVENSVDSEFLEAGRGTIQAGMGGWNMASVSKVTDSYFIEFDPYVVRVSIKIYSFSA